jgi:hypothetical protein
VITFPSEVVEEQAQMVLATLADTNAPTLHTFAEALNRADGPASRFSLAIYYLAGNRERGEPSDGLTLLTMRSALRDCATWGKRGAFIARLEHAKAPFWVAVHDALVTISEEMHATV